MKQVFVALALAACGGGGNGTDAPIAHDTAAIDARGDGGVDAPLDAAPDAAVDAGFDAPPSLSPACTTPPSVLIDVSPRRVGNLAIAGDTLYISAWEQDVNSNVTNAAVLAVDPVTGAEVAPPLVTVGATYLAAANGKVYAADPAGTIYELSPGTTPTAVVTGRTHRLGAVTADATHVYWSEQSPVVGDPGLILRAPLAGGASTTVMPTCNQPLHLHVTGGKLYCPSFGGSFWYGPVDGSNNLTIPYAGYPISSSIIDNGRLYFVNVFNNPQLWQLPLPPGSVTRIAQMPELGRFVGLAATSDYYYTVDDFIGLRRIRRSDAAIEIIYPTSGLSFDPVLYHNQVYVSAPDPVLSGNRFVRRCID